MDNSKSKSLNALSTAVIADAEVFLSKCDKRLAALIEDVGPCTIVKNNRRELDVLISSIISQQLSGKAATTIFNRLVDRAGTSNNFAESLINLSFAEVRSCGVSTAKANSILRLAELVTTNQLDLESLRELEDEAVYRQLTSISGIGPWTVQMFLIFALRRPDIFSTADAGLRRGLQKLYGMKEKPTEKEMLTITNRWRPYRTVGAWYLWRLID